MPADPIRRFPALAAAVLFVTLIACRWSPSWQTGEAPTGAAPATVAAPPTQPPPTPTEEPGAPPQGWLTYRNEMLGYAFDYPPQAELLTEGVTGYPSEELPAGLEVGQYFATLQAIYTEALCVGLRYGAASFYVGAPEDRGGRYATPCGRSGMGVYDLVTLEEAFVIGDQTLVTTGAQGYSTEDHTFLFETFMGRLNGFHFNIEGNWVQAGTMYEGYLVDKEVIRQILASWRWLE